MTTARIEGVATRRGDDPAAVVAPSAAALAANARLQELRRAADLPARRPPVGLDLAAVESRPPRPSSVDRAQSELEARRAVLGIDYRRPGVESADSSSRPRPAFEVLRIPQDLDQAGADDVGAPTGGRAAGSTARPLPPSPAGAAENGTYESGTAGRLKIWPDIHTAAHAAGLDTAGRLYLVCRDMDRRGAGRVLAADVRAKLEGRGVIGWKQIRQILAVGEGIFWERDDAGLLRLRRPGRILAALGVDVPRYRQIKIPTASIYGSIADYRAAAVYGGVLAGRRRCNAPISQAAIREATGGVESADGRMMGGLSERAQRRYRKSAAIEAARTWQMRPVGADVQTPLYEHSHGRRGRAAYIHHDRRGVLGPVGTIYIAHAAPNVYTHGQIERGRHGRRGKIARDLHHLNESLSATSMQNRQGNAAGWVKRRYYESPAVAQRIADRSHGRPIIYPLSRPPDGRPATYWGAFNV